YSCARRNSDALRRFSSLLSASGAGKAASGAVVLASGAGDTASGAIQERKVRFW
ncbi:hypothetical protein A2U01_0063256, partial [Trifolium medium]|nr:hypothetical protein [Trifolium medium]